MSLVLLQYTVEFEKKFIEILEFFGIFLILYKIFAPNFEINLEFFVV